MKNNLHLVQHLSRPLLYSRAIAHVKHYRGYGVHSPFVYSLVRNVFMKHQVAGENTELYERLRDYKISKKRAAQIQNMYDFCQYRSYVIDPDGEDSIGDDCLVIATKNITPAHIALLPETIGGRVATLCIMYPKTNARRNKACRELIKKHKGMSLDNIGFILLFYNDGRVKQHINI